ncbi:MAG: hypothetical protein ACFNUL_08505, partial [Cardiobacterium hominis]
IDICHVSALAVQALRVAVPAFLVAVFASPEGIQAMLDAIPKTITVGLQVAAMTVPENDLSRKAHETPRRSMPSSTTSGIAPPTFPPSRTSWRKPFPARWCARCGRWRRPKASLSKKSSYC